MTNKTAIMVPEEQQGAIEVRQQVNQIQYLMRDVLQEGQHYGTIKGCGNKPTLLQPGAEKIAYMFQLVPSYEVRRTDIGRDHREYEITCTLKHRGSGEVMGYGLGECSTMESKYRYRWVGYGDERRREENPDIADTWNTVLKMAKKRAFVDAVKSTTAASDIFTQDVEDMPAYLVGGAQRKPKDAHLQPIRDMFPAWRDATGHDNGDGMRDICSYAGVESMEQMTDGQVAEVVAWMGDQIRGDSAEPGSVDADEAEAPAEAADGYYEQDVEF